MKIFSKRSLTVFIAGSALASMFALAGTALAESESASDSIATSTRAMHRENFMNATTTYNRAGMMRGWAKQNKGIPQNPLFAGNGQPIVGGNVTAITGNSLTVTNKSNVTYTIDATSAKVTKPGVTSATLANVTIGDRVVVQGTVNGNSITASTIVDQGIAPSVLSNESASTSPAGETEHRSGGFFTMIGGFFSHLFGFF